VSITVYVNEIEKVIATLTGQDVFPRDVYYFDKIPTNLQATSVLFVNVGAVLIAVGASVFPSLRAALLHPVRALRFE
jgi:lipoprotein-releasing system permease protein